MAAFKTIDHAEMTDKRVLLRLDLNVPMKDGIVTDTTRIDRAIPTIEALSGRGAKVIILAHFGRPKGQRVPEMSLHPVVEPLSKALGGRSVSFATDCIGTAAEQTIDDMVSGDVVLLENIRFHAGEEANDPEFVAALASLGDIYVNDAFSASHRAHGSIAGIAGKLPSHAGLLMQGELEALSKALGNPARPVAAIVGGAKVSTKLELLGNLVSKVDRLIIGGGMANTFLYAAGNEIGASLAERDLAETAREIVKKADEAGCRIILQSDGVVAGKLESGVDTDVVSVSSVPSDKMLLDIGPASVDEISKCLEECKTLVWNGPVGAFEFGPFDVGTTALAQKAADLTDAGQLLTIAGGGDTVAALGKAGVVDRFSYVSTAGGAFLEWLEGKTLPGVAALSGT